ncbi:MAG: lysine-2,3-aminomutase-like protein [Proteobacteria bacterium]|nr:lysine-2,3-aminomutase-like protein [Pseudomonadota bacterium]
MTRARPLTRVADLVEAGLITPEDASAREAVAARYAVAITPTIAARIEHPDDPIARQFLPSPAELDTRPEESPDPIGDHPHSPLKGLVHRYPDRVLIKLTHTCPVYCRFCFRREMVGPAGDGNLTEAELDAAFAYIAAHPEIFEVIFTGGDPLMLSARRIRALGDRLAAIPHIRAVRWHSRVPIVAPERITPELARALRFPGKANYIAIHANHAREFSSEAKEALARLADHGIVLLGQSVLLRGVNADAQTLRALFLEMSANRIVPLYLHHPDLAPGTAHFRLSVRDGQAIHAALRGTLPGHAIPAYILDLPGGHGKVEIGAQNIEESAPGRLVISDRTGRRHDYAG